jgi:TolB-like protein/DNA-binding winged helix-turn-helix (wHTH) protein/tetratricopeptide (TPR) repeat protein
MVDPSLNSVSCEGTTVRLEPKVMQVLVCLAESAGQTISKETLFKSVWPDTFVTDDVLKHSIFELRRVFSDDPREPKFIQTVAKRGYRLIAPVNETANVVARLELTTAGDTGAASSRKRKWASAIVVLALLIAVLMWAQMYGLRKRTASSSINPPIHSLAVLPFQNLSRESDSDEEYFSEGITDGLITDLAQIDSLKVISRTSSMQYGQTQNQTNGKPLPEIARELGVDGIVEGTIQRSGNRVLIHAQLIYGPSDRHVWATSFEGDVTDAFTLERNVTREIAHQIEARLETPNRPTLDQPRPANPGAFDAYLRGNYHLDKYGRGGGDDENRKALEYFQQAIDADPNFAPAYVGIANADSNRFYGSNQDTAMMRKAAERAVALAPSFSGAWSTLAYSKSLVHDWSGAEADYRKSVALNPNNAPAHRAFCDFLGVHGRVDEAKNECELAQELDPRNDHLSWILYLQGDYDRSIAVAKMMLENHPNDGYSHHLLYQVYTKKGMERESIQELAEAMNSYGLPQLADSLRHALAASGYSAAMREYAKQLKHLDMTKQMSMPVNLAEVYAVMGDRDRAFYWLEQAYEHRGAVTPGADIDYLEADPMLVPLRSDPRFKDLVRRMGLPPTVLSP